ncbi:Origin recognition complex subunit 5 [Lecanosticta acicola]|uniref:Origin recognition complex subunit 5 n=1 Tax=Lecanosticta acicola TaxID=111012 RepID=A0AAI9ECK6_9PEZI|nr:Origin recognition complex subunit 5 [Lecanosticta acicola]
MGLPLLPDEMLLQWPCRETQLRQLGALFTSPCPSTIVVYGPCATGKSSIVASHLKTTKFPHGIVRSRECVTGRHLLERTVDTVYQARGGEMTNDRCENLGALLVHLQRALEDVPKFALLFDGVDRQREGPPTLLPALARLGEAIPQLTVILIVRHPSPRFLHQGGVPHVYFAPYSRSQAIHIVSRHPVDIFLEPPPDDMDYEEEQHDEDKAWLWPRFCAAVWDALAQNAARDLVGFREACDKLWRPFVAPIIKGDFGTRDFSRLFVAQRRLFQDETALLNSIVPRSQDVLAVAKGKPHELPYYAKWLLVAAYLASFNPAKLDSLYFMKSTEKKRKKKGGGTARAGGRRSQTRKIPRHLLAASAFTVDRLLAILHAILPDDTRATVDLYRQIATLSSLRLLVRAGGIGGADPLEAGGKWRVGPMVTWEHVQSLARNLDFNFTDYVVD